MKFLFKWLRNGLQQAINEERNTCDAAVPSKLSRNSFDTRGTNFSVYRADGGFVVETSWRDDSHDNHSSLYIITHDQNFGEKISQILTFEEVKR